MKKSRYGPLRKWWWLNWAANQLCLQDDIISDYNKYKHIKEANRKSFLLSRTLTAERPISFEKGSDWPRGAAPPLVGWVEGRVEARGNNTATGSGAGWSTLSQQRSTFAKPQGSETQRGFVYSFSLDFQSFGSVESSCVAVDWFCVCTADHTSVIFNRTNKSAALSFSCCDHHQAWVQPHFYFLCEFGRGRIFYFFINCFVKMRFKMKVEFGFFSARWRVSPQHVEHFEENMFNFLIFILKTCSPTSKFENVTESNFNLTWKAKMCRD